MQLITSIPQPLPPPAHRHRRKRKGALRHNLPVRQLTVVVPYLVSEPEQESALRSLPEGLQRMVECGSVSKIEPLSEATTPEAAWLALDPDEVQVPQGPLTVAALGHRPPSGSVHFHLSLCSADEDGKLQIPEHKPTTTEVKRIFQEVQMLATRALTPLEGEGPDHALVWEEGSLEMAAQAPAIVAGKPILNNTPQGEGEKILRRFIDDAVNILDPLEVNHIRREEGMRPLNCLWPWGQGFRPDLPSLPIRRGDVVYVESGSMRMHGLCDMVGYRHGDRAKFGKGIRTDFDRILRITKKQKISLTLLHSIQEMQAHARIDEIVWNLEQLSEKVFEPLMENEERSPFVLRLVAPGGQASIDSAPELASSTGLALVYDSRKALKNNVPFDERVLDDPRVPSVRAWEFIHPGLIGAY